MSVQVDGPHGHDTRQVLSLKANARDHSTVNDENIAYAADLPDFENNRAVLQPRSLLVAQFSGDFALRGVIWVEILFRVTESAVDFHLGPQKENAVLMVSTHAGSFQSAREFYDTDAVGSFVDHVAGKDKVVSSFGVKRNLLQKTFH